MRKIDKISVVMPAYNAMPFLPEAVESILKQSFQAFDLVIVDDGSTDSSKNYLDSLTDPRVRVIHQENRGIVEALNVGIRQARFDWIARMDGDDVALPHRLERQVRFLEANEAFYLVSCAWGFIGSDGRRLKAVHVTQLNSPPYFQPLVDPMIAHPGMTFSKKAVLRVGGYRGISAEDLDLCLRLDEAGYRMTSIPEVLMLLRVLPTGISSSIFVQQRVLCDYVRACSMARREGRPEPSWEAYRAQHWPRGWKRLRLEGARQFRQAGAAWGTGRYCSAGGRLLLSFLLRPDYVFSRLRLYFLSGRAVGPLAGGGDGE